MLKQKQKNKKRKLYHFINLIDDFNFYNSIKYNYNGFNGVLYEIDKFYNYKKADTKEEYQEKIKKVYNNYENTYFLNGCCKYAPELKKVYLFVAR